MQECESSQQKQYSLILYVNGRRATAPYKLGENGEVIFQQGVLGEALKKLLENSKDMTYPDPMGVEWR